MKPPIDVNFRTLPEARPTGIAGNSLGGLVSFYFGYRHPKTFGMAICFSPSLWHTDSILVREVAADRVKRTATRFWINGGEIDSATIETIAPVMTKLPSNPSSSFQIQFLWSPRPKTSFGPGSMKPLLFPKSPRPSNEILAVTEKNRANLSPQHLTNGVSQE